MSCEEGHNEAQGGGNDFIHTVLQVMAVTDLLIDKGIITEAELQSKIEEIVEELTEGEE